MRARAVFGCAVEVVRGWVQALLPGLEAIAQRGDALAGTVSLARVEAASVGATEAVIAAREPCCPALSSVAPQKTWVA